MASTLQARKLTESHRIAQARIGAQTVKQMLSAWAVMDAKDLDATLKRWLMVVFPIVGQQRTTSSRLAGSYAAAFRALELGPEPFTPKLAGGVSTKSLITSLTVTGPVAVKLAMARGEMLDRAMNIGAALSAGAGMRAALDGGRETLVETVQSDERALGWARVTSGAPCAFCAMLASRGPVYGEATGDFQAHDACACAVEPVYTQETDWPPGSQEYRDLWEETGSLHEFRQAFESKDEA